MNDLDRYVEEAMQEIEQAVKDADTSLAKIQADQRKRREIEAALTAEYGPTK
jgi:hypothetical protein